ncbi:hypothetical protein AciX9_1367 [Granulicella tundricola MP5ACTX9]|uniref:Uncharacterized protein n=1 Tax=Granulicella tundricola (strain ATCC BAA-1859 / DSM 23138 / MP5ACTX9) TaxID=1198114 RepID=E8WVH9_GRATM|nr:hypothetical protein AciX9_1367 [Granulicella tundricola MP5ACTX9]
MAEPASTCSDSECFTPPEQGGQEQPPQLNHPSPNVRKSHKKDMDKLSEMAASVKSAAASAKTPEDAKRLTALSEIMEHPTA